MLLGIVSGRAAMEVRSKDRSRGDGVVLDDASCDGGRSEVVEDGIEVWIVDCRSGVWYRRRLAAMGLSSLAGWGSVPVTFGSTILIKVVENAPESDKMKN